MQAEFKRFQPTKVLPQAIIDFVMRDHNYGINSVEFEKAVAGGDSKNIMEGVDWLIRNAEIRLHTPLSELDRLMVSIIVQDEIIAKLMKKAAMD